MSNLEKLQHWLDTHACALGGFTVHPEAKPSAEEIAGEILKSLERLERGEYELFGEIGGNLSQSSWDEFDD